MGDTTRSRAGQPAHRRRTTTRSVGLLAATALLASLLPAAASAQQPPIDPTDPRVGLAAGIDDAGEAAFGVEHLANVPKPDVFANPDDLTDLGANIAVANSDLAFSGDRAIMGSYQGFSIYDISDPAAPSLEVAVVCPGGQGDVSIDGDLLVVSIESGAATECGVPGEGAVPFAGVRVFDLGAFFDSGDAEDVALVAEVQTCRGSHTHTLVDDPDGENVYVYVSGTSGVRSPASIPDDEDLTCEVGPMVPAPTEDDPDRMVPSNDPADFPPGTETDRFQIEIIEVPLDAPETAAIIEEPRLFAAADGSPHGLEPGGSQGAGFQTVATTDSCHDITAYSEIGLAAGACEGNGILIDISDPTDPRRIDDVSDRNFAYWHSATFSNDGSTVIFTDEWGGGVGANCKATDRPEWGANGIFEVVGEGDDRRLEFASYYKLPAPQTEFENCVAHNGSLIPIPGRDVMVQAWYQGGLSVWEFTDPTAPVELGYFDRGPLVADALALGGFWSAYWYDGHMYGSEIVRGFDTFALEVTDLLSQDEIDAAEDVTYGGQFNPQNQVSYDVEDPDDPDGPDDPGPACDAVEPVSFTDAGGPPHGPNIGCVAGYGIALGTGDGVFSPGADVQRGQMATFITNLLTVGGVELPAPSEPGFDDIAGTTHADQISRLAAAGIVSGVGDGRFDPTGSVTRGQMATFLVNALEFALDADLEAPASPFTDAVGTTHADSIDVAFDLGIANGLTTTTFGPGRDVLRGQMATFLANTLDAMVDAGLTLTPRPTD